ncbi:MAG: transposase [Nocardioidaceae bacterium]|nr:transposase [Nocardioidaceae bacterium]
MDVFCGIDWSEDHHDVALVDADGVVLAQQRISHDTAGFAALLGLLGEHGDSAEQPMPVAVETSRGLLVAALRATGGRCSRDQPVVGVALPRPAQCRPAQVRSRRCTRSRAPTAHQHGRPPTDPSR